MLLSLAGLIYTLATWAALCIHSDHPVRQLIITGVLGAITGVPSVAFMLDRQLGRPHRQLQGHLHNEIIAPSVSLNPVSTNDSEMTPSVIIPLKTEAEERFSIHCIPPGKALKNETFSMPFLVIVMVGSLVIIFWFSRRTARERHGQYVQGTRQVAYPFVVDRAPSLQEQMDALINGELPHSCIDHLTCASHPGSLSFEAQDKASRVVEACIVHERFENEHSGTIQRPQQCLVPSHSKSPPVPERVSSPKDTPFNNSSLELSPSTMGTESSLDDTVIQIQQTGRKKRQRPSQAKRRRMAKRR